MLRLVSKGADRTRKLFWAIIYLPRMGHTFQKKILKTVTNQFNHLLTIIIISLILLILEPFRIMLCEVLESVAVQNPPCLRRL